MLWLWITTLPFRVEEEECFAGVVSSGSWMEALKSHREVGRGERSEGEDLLAPYSRYSRS